MILRKNILFLIGIMVIAPFASISQKTQIYTDKYKAYRDGLELFDKQKFAAAKKQFEEVIAIVKNDKDEIQVSAEYYRGACALELFNGDAHFLLSQFMVAHPDAPQSKKVPFLLGRDFYRQKDYQLAIEWFEKVDKYDLTKDEVIEYHFKFGYSYFSKNKLDKAKSNFYEIKDVQSDYFGPANYYYGHLSYLDSNYQTALESFRKIENTPGFSPIVPYYISQILFIQGKYQEVIDYAPPILEGEEVKREGEINGIIGSSYFKLKQYDKSIPYFEDYFRNADAKTEDDYYQLGFAYYQVKQYEKAIKYLGRVAANDDERAQICNYILAESYIKTDNKEYAKAAFKRAYDLGFDKAINEDALFGYAKASYELAYNPYDEATEIFHKFLDEFPNSTKKNQVYEYLLDVYTTTKNYEQALISINRIKDKNFQIKEAYQKLSYNRAVELFYKQNYTESAKYFSEVKTYNIDPSLNARSKFWLAEIDYREGKFAEAISEYKNFKTTSGAQSTNLTDLADYNIGYAYFDMSDYKNAIYSFKIFVDETNDKEKKGDANLRLGDAYYLEKDDKNAAKYYQRAIDLNQKNVDYAIYQKAIVSGYMDDNDEKERLLSKLLREYPNSIYAKNSTFELANTYRNQRNDTEALKLYKQIVESNPTGEQRRKALLNIGGIHLRNKRYGDAEDVFEQIVREFPNTVESEAAINELEKAYTDQGKIDQFPDLLSRLGIQYSASKLDSTLWVPANQAYLNGDCDNAQKAINAYLDKIQNPSHYVSAYFYLGECAYLKKNYDQALTYYEKVINRKQMHLEDALYHSANITYLLERFEKSYEYYVQLEPLNADQVKTATINKGIMRTAYKLKKWEKAITYASKVLADGGTNKALEQQATMIKATSNFELGNYTTAKPLFKQVVTMANDIDKAIAKYRICEILYLEKKYKESEDELFEFIKQKPTYDYWLAKGFILLSDVYVKLGDNYQAKATLQSVIDNYVGDDEIIETAQAKLEAIKAAEKAGDAPKNIEEE